MNKLNLKLRVKEEIMIFKNENIKTYYVYIGLDEIGYIREYNKENGEKGFFANARIKHWVFRTKEDAINFLVEENKRNVFIEKAKRVINSIIKEYRKKKITEIECLNQIKEVLNELEKKLNSKLNIKTGVFE